LSAGSRLEYSPQIVLTLPPPPPPPPPPPLSSVSVPVNADSREGRWQQAQGVPGVGGAVEPPVQKSELMSRLLGGMQKKAPPKARL
jgi:hypothetical protein